MNAIICDTFIHAGDRRERGNPAPWAVPSIARDLIKRKLV